MKFRKSLALGAVLCAAVMSSTANAGVTVTHTSTATGPLSVNDTFTVDVVAGYDGTPTLTGIFVSASWDETELSLQGTPTAPNFAIFGPGPNGFLSKVSDPSVFPGDPSGTIRTIQYGANPGQSANGGADVVVTTLTFQVIGAGDGTAEVDIAFNAGDVILGAAGAELDPGDVTLTDFSIAVPEAGSAAMAFSVLGTIGLISRWRGARD